MKIYSNSKGMHYFTGSCPLDTLKNTNTHNTIYYTYIYLLL